MFSAWYALKDHINYKEDRNDVFDNWLFSNPKIVKKNKTLLWVQFYKSKHDTYQRLFI